MNKSHVSMEEKVCKVCGQRYDTGALLLDKRLKNSLDMYTVTGWGLCENDRQKIADGFVALIGAIPPTERSDTMKPEEANRTGEVVYVKRKSFAKIFNVDAPPEGIAFIDPLAISQLKKMTGEA